MRRPTLTGSRVRARRLDRGLKQAELARRCDISPSYLNLIEHNRRSIGGRLLVQLAEALDVEPAALSEGADMSLLSALRDAAAGPGGGRAEEDRTEEFAGRFPGWARLVAIQARRIETLERTIEALNDRLTHDPFLSTSLHDILSTVTAIRSTSAILREGTGVDPEWQARFHRNIYEDSQRLADASRSLVAYLDAGGEAASDMASPQEELEAWLGDRAYRVEELEDDPGADVAAILADGKALRSSASRELAEGFLRRYASDVRSLPAAALAEAVGSHGKDPARLSAALGVGLPVVFRRMVATAVPDAGLIACDGSGTPTFRKPVDAFQLPRFGAACPLLPLYQALARPGVPIRAVIEVPGRAPLRMLSYAVAEMHHPSGFGAPPVVDAWMLLLPHDRGGAEEPAIPVGVSCRICPRAGCAARREPSILSAG